MATTILGWAALAMILAGGAAVFFGMRDMGASSGEAKMGGAMLTMIGAAPLALGCILGIVWLAVK